MAATASGGLLSECTEIIGATTNTEGDIRLGTITLRGIALDLVTTSIMLNDRSRRGLDPYWAYSSSSWSKLVDRDTYEAVIRVDYPYFRLIEYETPLPASVFITDSNIIGIAARDIVVGDILALLNGAKLPVILRRQEDMSFHVIDAIIADNIDPASPFDTRGSCLEIDFVLS